MALVKCKSCGQLISERAQKCPHCGCPVKTSGNRALIVAIIIITAIIIAGGVCFLLLDKKDNKEHADNSTSELIQPPVEKQEVTLSDVEKLGLSGKVKNMVVIISYEDSEGYSYDFTFNEDGYITEATNLSIGFPEDWSGEGMTNVCYFKNGRIVESSADNGDQATVKFEYIEDGNSIKIIRTENQQSVLDNMNMKTSKKVFESALLSNGDFATLSAKKEFEKFTGYGCANLITPAQNDIESRDSNGNWTNLKQSKADGARVSRDITYFN